MNRSHSRHSYPLDKSVPLMEKRTKKTIVSGNQEYTFYEGYNSGARQEMKDMHNTKQRQYDKKLCQETESES